MDSSRESHGLRFQCIFLAQRVGKAFEDESGDSVIKSWQAICPVKLNSLFSDLANESSSAEGKSEESLAKVFVVEERKRLQIASGLSINAPKDED